MPIAANNWYQFSHKFFTLPQRERKHLAKETDTRLCSIGIYANLYWWEVILKKGLERFTKWVAQYNVACEYDGAHLDIWQFTSHGKVDGIYGDVDVNECYRDFPAEILGEEAQQPVIPAEPKQEEKAAAVDYAAEFCLEKAGTYRVRANGGLNLRSGASMDKQILETMADESIVICYGYYTGEWLYVVSASGKKGFCHGDYLEKV